MNPSINDTLFFGYRCPEAQDSPLGYKLALDGDDIGNRVVMVELVARVSKNPILKVYEQVLSEDGDYIIEDGSVKLQVREYELSQFQLFSIPLPPNFNHMGWESDDES